MTPEDIATNISNRLADTLKWIEEMSRSTPTPTPQGGEELVTDPALAQTPLPAQPAFSDKLPPQRSASEQQADPQGNWTTETARNLDLSDARITGAKDQEREDISGFGEVNQLMDRYSVNLNRLLGKMQDLLIENINHLEVLESHWQRLK